MKSASVRGNRQNKFNPLQQLAYLAIMYALVPLLIITGFAYCLYPQVLEPCDAGAAYGACYHQLTVYLRISICVLLATRRDKFSVAWLTYHRHRTAPREDKSAV